MKTFLFKFNYLNTNFKKHHCVIREKNNPNTNFANKHTNIH
ncbi:hypothetical protein EMIT036CA2_10243 [Chryseobacterium sp. IT-36CA2]